VNFSQQQPMTNATRVKIKATRDDEKMKLRAINRPITTIN
jgi:hypothetical protein